MVDLDAFLADATIDAAVFALRPDYRALLIAADGIEAGPGDDAAEPLLVQAEEHARRLLESAAVDQLPHVAAWRDAYRDFGAKPQRTRNSVEALTRRAPQGLPRVNRLTDLYNAISVLHQLPIGGEDLARYAGSPRLIRASGEETFDTVAGGVPVVERPERGEVVWADRAGVTCRRWNWRQARRTALREDSRAVLFILDALAPMTDDALLAAGEELRRRVTALGTDVRATVRLLGPTETAGDRT